MSWLRGAVWPAGMRSWLVLIAVVCVFAACSGSARADGAARGYDEGFIMLAGDSERGWLITKSLGRRARPYTLFQMPPDVEIGALRSMGGLASAPEHLLPIGDGLVLVYGASEGESSRRRVRVIRLSSGVGSSATAMRLMPLPALPGAGEIEALVFAGGRSYALLSGTSVAPAGYELLRLAGGAWESVTLPEGVPAEAALAVRGEGEELRLTARGTSEIEEWLGVYGDDGFAWAVDSGEGDRTPSPAQVHELVGEVPGDAATAMIRGARVYAWPAGEGTMRVRMLVLSPDGALLYNGDARMRGPISPTDVQTLALAMLALCVLVTVFVVRPGQEKEPYLPDGFALAPPFRRGVAWLLDLAPGVAMSVLIWPGLLDQPQAILGGASEAGPWPVTLIIVQFMVLCTLGEAFFGRTLGKFLMGLRTITYEGEPPTVWMAFSRNVVRVLVPPLAVFSALNPSMPQPSAFQTLVVVRRRGV